MVLTRVVPPLSWLGRHQQQALPRVRRDGQTQRSITGGYENVTSRRENRSSSWLTTPLVPSWVLLWLAWLLAAPFPIGITTTGVLILVLWITRARRGDNAP
jgi:hypothetical protein